MHHEEITRQLAVAVGGEYSDNRPQKDGIYLQQAGFAKPSTGGIYQGTPCKFEFLIPHELRIDAYTDSPVSLKISRRGVVSFFLDQLGLQPGIKTGVQPFDDDFTVAGCTKETAARFLTQEIKNQVISIKGLIYLKIKHDEFEMLISLDPEQYSCDQALKDLGTLIRIAELLKKLK
ncbi:MAG: hypothetical protein PHQ23_14420 [Candidatus Wallbacteria bacterium]|nr:hypothetical protein [Candidatus Wallbacteria bacterium]